MEWCLKGLRSCLDILSEGQKLAKPNTRSLAIDPNFHYSRTEASTLASASEMSARGSSTPVTTLLTEELVVVSHTRPVPNPRPSTQTSPSTSSLAPPFPSPRPSSAGLLMCASRKRILDGLQIYSDSRLESDTPSMSAMSRALSATQD
ncbi:hypothetical protein BDR04DRAFT_1086267 [Suillus decipiens]|nr:hypothetical protein BDR04DRAFT_1086267 [Suillus decipiens]